MGSLFNKVLTIMARGMFEYVRFMLLPNDLIPKTTTPDGLYFVGLWSVRQTTRFPNI